MDFDSVNLCFRRLQVEFLGFFNNNWLVLNALKFISFELEKPEIGLFFIFIMTTRFLLDRSCFLLPRNIEAFLPL